MAKQKNLLNRINQRRKGALSRLEDRMKLSNDELFKTANRFRSALSSGEESITEDGFNTYREYMKKQADILSSRIIDGR